MSDRIMVARRLVRGIIGQDEADQEDNDIGYGRYLIMNEK